MSLMNYKDSPLDLLKDDVDAFDEQITEKRQEVHACPASDPERGLLLNDLADDLFSRFEQRGGLDDLEEAIALQREALEGNPNDVADVGNLANLLQVRFERLGGEKDLEEAITAFRRLLEFYPVGHQDRCVVLNDLSNLLARRFERLGDLKDINESVLVKQDVVRLTPDSHPDKPSYLNNLGDSLLQRFDRLGDLNDINESILIQQDAVRLTPDSHPDRPVSLGNLGNSLLSRFKCFGNLSDINESILVKQAAVHLTPDDHPNKPIHLDSLCTSLLLRFERLGNLSDINESIRIQQDAVRLTPDNDLDKPTSMSNLGNSLLARFERLGDLKDINESILIQQDAVRLTPDSHPDRPVSLSNLGNSLLSRFQRLGDINDINESIVMKRDAVRLTPDGHPNEPSRLHNLANSLLFRFNRLGDLNDINESILIQQDAVRLTPDGHPDKPPSLSNLGSSLVSRFEHLGDLSDLNKSILMGQDAARLTPDNHPNKLGYLSNFSNLLTRRFQHLGELSDINEAILIQQDVVRLTPDGHPDRPDRLSNLGTSLLSRFERLGDFSDLNQSILLQQNAMRTTPDSHPSKPIRSNNLSGSLLRRFERLNDLTDINESIVIKRDALRLTPEGHPGRPVYLNNLCNSLTSRFNHLGDLSDINESIHIQQDAVHFILDSHPNKPGFLSNLTYSLLARFKRLGDLNDLNKSILIQQDAVRLIPDGHPDQPTCLSFLGDSLFQRFEHHNDITDGTQALEQYSSAARALTGPPFVRFLASSRWSRLAVKLRDSSIFTAYSTALSLLPELAWLGSPVPDRHFQIQLAGDVVRRGAAAAIEVDNRIISVEWLEQGRSIIWGQILHLRTPLDALKASHPVVGTDLEELSMQLEGASTRSLVTPLQSSSNLHTQKSLNDVAKDYHTLADKRKKLIDKIRTLPGFEQFLLPKSFRDLARVANEAGGPIVMLNATIDRCDALILKPGLLDDVIHVPLPNMSLAVATDFQKSLKLLLKGHIPTTNDFPVNAHSVNAFSKRLGIIFIKGDTHQELQDRWFWVLLSSLWDWVVEPVVKELHLTTEHLTRLWWCPAGIFSSLPLHAAGRYSSTDPFGSKLSDYAISSYTLSITALLQALDAHPKVSKTPNILVVAQPAANGQAWLPGTEEEMRLIKERAGDAIPVTTLIKSEATIDRVKDGMRSSSHVHFACHGVQKANSPTESALLLADSSRLTLSEIISMKLDLKDLAFLSACQTATGDENLPDEAVHLAAGMLLAGYHGVIATMWTIQDNHAPQVARDVYEVLFQDPHGGATKAAEALHFAVKNLRESGAPPSSWIPFIHLGI